MSTNASKPGSPDWRLEFAALHARSAGPEDLPLEEKKKDRHVPISDEDPGWSRQFSSESDDDDVKRPAASCSKPPRPSAVQQKKRRRVPISDKGEGRRRQFSS